MDVREKLRSLQCDSQCLHALQSMSYEHVHVLRDIPMVIITAGLPLLRIGNRSNFMIQAVFPACLVLAMLYLNVLSLGILMTGYLKWKGMTEATLSVFRGLGAIAGLSATFAFPALHGGIGAARKSFCNLL